MTTARPDSRLGTDLGPYRIERVLGRGGMGVVYLAEQRELGRKVALKLLPDELANDADFRARFERESRLAASIDHPNIIPLYEAGEIDGTAFLAMRFVDGVDLASRLADGPLDAAEAIAILAQVAGALDAAHSRGLVHRDVKPGNVLLDRTAQGEHAYLTDFGLTKQAGTESGLTRVGSFMGTPAYMAPEQIEGQEVDGRADQYSLACMAFELLTGTVPFKRDQEFAVAMAHVRDRPPAATNLRSDLPAAVDVVFAQAMAKDREARYEACVAFIEDLRSALGGGVVAARPIRAPRRRGPTLVAAALGLGLVAVAGLVLASGLLGRGSAASPSGSAPAAFVSPISAEPTDSPTPDPSIFPNTDEQAVLAFLPPTLRETCRRGGGRADTALAGWQGRVPTNISGDPPVPGGFQDIQPPSPRVSLTCTPSDGASAAYVQTFRSEGGTTDPGSVADTAISYLASRYKLPDKDCTDGTAASGDWSLGGSSLPNGYLVCLPESSFDGHAWVYWTFDRGRILAFATREDSDYSALYDWWKDLTLFIE
jgi:serine/threonine protein kinase